MLWLQPAAWFGLVAVAAPLLIHLLVHRRSERLDFPTLRFLQATRFASMRRHTLGDLPLLLVRAALLAAAVAALAAPLLTTAARRASWNARVARVVVVDPREPGRAARLEQAQRELAAAFRGTIIETPDAASGLRRAAAWLDTAPPARREVVYLSPLPIGTIGAGDVSSVPRGTGLRFVRSGSLPATRTVPGAPVLGWADSRTGGDPNATPTRRPGPIVRDRRVTLDGRSTAVVDGPSSSGVLPLDVIAPSSAQPVVDAAVRAVLQGRVLAPRADARATLLITGAPGEARVRESAEAVRSPGIGDAVARMTSDRDVAAAARDVRAPVLDAAMRRAPWQTVASGATGAPIVAAAQSGTHLVVVSAAEPADALTPVLIRSILNALSFPSDAGSAEIVPIPDAQLRAWEQQPGPAPMPDASHPIDDASDDRRWFWAAALCLAALEGWMRSGSRDAADAALVAGEDQRVA